MVRRPRLPLEQELKYRDIKVLVPRYAFAFFVTVSVAWVCTFRKQRYSYPRADLHNSHLQQQLQSLVLRNVAQFKLLSYVEHRQPSDLALLPASSFKNARCATSIYASVHDTLLYLQFCLRIGTERLYIHNAVLPDTENLHGGQAASRHGSRHSQARTTQKQILLPLTNRHWCANKQLYNRQTPPAHAVTTPYRQDGICLAIEHSLAGEVLGIKNKTPRRQT